MAVDALELRPRTTVALFDAAIRVCATSTGVWALTLPAGAALTAALFNAAEAVQHHQDLKLPVLLWTLAWCFRALSQGAATWYVEQQVLAPHEPSARAAYLAALKRAPSLIITAAFTAGLNAVLLVFTLGIGFLFVGAHTVAYAATMRGQGSALGVYGTSARLLGPARQTAAFVRLAGFTQLLVALNLATGVSAALGLGQSLLGLDLTFAARFTSMDNGVWLATLAVVTFSLFEPLRAATAALLLIDGRVRQEGLDLLASVEQLPARRKPKAAAAAPIVAALALLLPSLVQAEPTELRGRVERLAKRCRTRVDRQRLQDIDQLDERDRGALERFVARVERRAYDGEDCEGASDDLREGLQQLGEARRAAGASDSAAARTAAKAILARPEFQTIPEQAAEPEKPKEDEAPGWFQKAWEDFWNAVFKWLRQSEPREREQPADLPDLAGPGIGVDFVIVLAVIVVVAVLVFILLRWREKKSAAAGGELVGDGVTQTPLTADPMSALARPPESWAGLADELAARGEFREAIRHLYLALLSRLHREGAIDYDPARSNWDYLQGFKGPLEFLGRFRDLTRRFDFAWYGNLEVNPAAYATFRDTAQPMLAPAAGAGHA